MSHQPARILIVDDHEDNLALLTMILSSQGYAIRCASDGPQALVIVRDEPPDLILLDVMMPRMSGYDVVQAVRADASDSYIPIMLITAKQELADKVKGLDLGADDFLPKPVQGAELIAKVRALLRLKQVQDELIRERNKNELLYQVGRQLNSTLDVDQLITTTLHLMLPLAGATQGSVIVRDPVRETWRRIIARAPVGMSELPDASAAVIRQGLAGRALRSREPQLVRDTATDSRWIALHQGASPVRSALAIPLVRDATELGVLTLTHDEPDRFGEELLPLAMAVAAQVSTALHNASLYTRLKEAESMREYFVHMLTHDLRGPLSGIAGCLHVLGLTARDENETQFLAMARRACAAQEELIDDILDVYRADSGLLEIHRTAFAPAALAEPVLDQMAGAAAERGIDLTIDLPDEPLIVADQSKLARVLNNLVANAIKFTRRGGVRVMASVDPARESLVFAVRDTGTGIPPEDLEHIFDRFFRSRRPGGRRGSGLGLNFCREVIRAHGGAIWAESAPDAGTTMRFSIPLKGGSDDEMARADRG
jgi:signal transduction histidine kinase/CheY-like chemotaxis protein